ncbi:MAG: hypothetical protein R3B72_21515 [Polyangiaceae bacterium]
MLSRLTIALLGTATGLAVMLGDVRPVAAADSDVEPSSVEPSRSAADVALRFVPFGVGQFANGDLALGADFAIAEATLLSTSLATYFVAEDARASCVNPGLTSDCGGMQARFERARAVNYSALALGIAHVVLGGIEAVLAQPGNEHESDDATTGGPVFVPQLAASPEMVFVGGGAAF